MIIKQAVILAGGLGKRLGDKSLNCPKPMQLVNGEPFLNNIIWNLKRHDIKNIILSVGYLAKNFKDYYGNGSKFEVNISYVEEKAPMGTGGALKNCESLLDDNFFLLNGDTIFDLNFHDLALSFQKGKLGHLALNLVHDASRYGKVTTDQSDIISFEEKNDNSKGYINSGVAILNKKILDFIPLQKCSLEKDIFQKLVLKNLLSAKKYKSFFLDIGIPTSLKDAQFLIPKWRSKSALLLDRDGVINIDYGYVHNFKNFKYIEGAKEIIKMANDLGILVLVITNQSGIARGYYTEKSFKKFSAEINENLKKFGAHIDDTYFCPHHPQEGKGDLKKNCNCRKPAPGMIIQAIKDWNLDKQKCFLIGDKETDVLAASKCDISSHLFSSQKDNLIEIFRKKIPYLLDLYNNNK